MCKQYIDEHSLSFRSRAFVLTHLLSEMQLDWQVTNAVTNYTFHTNFTHGLALYTWLFLRFQQRISSILALKYD